MSKFSFTLIFTILINYKSPLLLAAPLSNIYFLFYGKVETITSTPSPN